MLLLLRARVFRTRNKPIVKDVISPRRTECRVLFAATAAAATACFNNGAKVVNSVVSLFHMLRYLSLLSLSLL
jgi:hypothetical protein